LARILENPKQLIFINAKEIFLNEGYEKLSMRALSKKCDIALGTIYNYYPTKKELVIEMMTDYWKENFYVFFDILNSEEDIDTKLSKTFDKLGVFIKTFKEIWLKPELYKTPEYIEEGVDEELIYMEKLIVMIEAILLKEKEKNNITLKLGSYETSKFILMNFITMVQMPQFKYSSFELFLKEII
jgi:AcrR family transcriptional regulator